MKWVQSWIFVMYKTRIVWLGGISNLPNKEHGLKNCHVVFAK